MMMEKPKVKISNLMAMPNLKARSLASMRYNTENCCEDKESFRKLYK
jgi:hypothetical protein